MPVSPRQQPTHRVPEAAPIPLTLAPDARILVVKLASLGDMLLATPALRALRRRYPHARIDVLTTQGTAPLLADSPLIDHIYTLDKYAYDTPGQAARNIPRLAEMLPLLRALRCQRYDALLLGHHLTLRFGRLKYRALLAAIAARRTVGLDNGHGGFLDERVPDHGFGARHEAEYMLALAAALDAALPGGERGLRLADLGWAALTPQPPSPEGKGEKDYLQGKFPLAPLALPPQPPSPGGKGEQEPGARVAPLVALHPGGGTYSVARRWPAARFIEVAAALHAEMGADIVLVGGAEERALHEGILAALGMPDWARSAAGETAPRQLAALVGQCALFIGNDSLPMHLAAAAGIPVVAIFGPSNAAAWRPWVPDAPARAVVVRRHDLACMPCFYRGHELGTPQGCPPRMCLTELGSEPVLVAARRLLGRSRLAGVRAE